MNQKLLCLFIATFCFTQLILAQSTNEKIAENWIKQNTKSLEIQPHHNFKMLFNRKGPSGETLRYYQMVNDVQVYGAELTIHINTIGEVSYVANAYNKNIEAIDTNPAISLDEAYSITIKKLNTPGLTRKKEEGLFVYPNNGETKLVYSIKTSSESLNGYWETIIDAKNGNIISSKDVALYHKHDKDKKKNSDKKKENKISSGNNTAAVMATGTAMVFNSDPLSEAQVAYGGNYVDGNGQGDTDTAELTAARTQVNLPDIEFSGGTYRLRGQYAEIASLQNPNTGLFTQASNAFHFTRNEQGFEAAQVYYHVDKSIRYINETLGITLVSRFNNGVVEFDPHAHNGADQSTYGGGELNFGEGGIDDGECTDVILHELGHGLHDWVTNGNLSQVNGLSEGSGDYWAQSYSRSVNGWTTANDPHNLYNKVFKWDGNDTWNGRRSDVTALYPDDLVGGGPHTDGQMWATVLMEIYDLIGRTKIDAAFLEGLGMTNGSTGQQDAAIAVRQAAMDMVLANRFGMTCSDVDVMTARFTARGYVLPALDCAALGVSEFEINNISIFPNPATNSITIKNIIKEYTIQVYNIIGQKIMEENITPNNNKIDVSNISNGTYILKLKDYSGALKFIKL